MRVEEIPIDKIIIPEKRARATFTPEQFEELKASIRTHGFTIPILVKDNGDGTYLLIDGEHRIKAAKELGYEKVPAVITEGDEKKITLLNVLANTARGTQNPMDVAEALLRAKQAGATEEELAAATGHDIRWVRLYLALNDLPDEYKEALRSGKLKVGHIKECMRLNDPVEIDACLQSVLVHDWTVSVTKYYVDQRLETLRSIKKEGGNIEPPPPPTPEEAQEMVQWAECSICHRKVNRFDMRMPPICQDCYNLLEYIVSQLGDPREAMRTIYNALSLYFDMMKKQEEERKMQQLMSMQQQSVPAGTQQQNNILSQLGIDEETLKLAKKIKALKEAGLL